MPMLSRLFAFSLITVLCIWGVHYEQESMFEDLAQPVDTQQLRGISPDEELSYSIDSYTAFLAAVTPDSELVTGIMRQIGLNSEAWEEFRRIKQSQRTHRALHDKLLVSKIRCDRKQEIVNQLAEGRQSLQSAAEEFAHLDEDATEAHMNSFRSRYDGRDDYERYLARIVEEMQLVARRNPTLYTAKYEAIKHEYLCLTAGPGS